jgi:hypothetical protein
MLTLTFMQITTFGAAAAAPLYVCGTCEPSLCTGMTMVLVRWTLIREFDLALVMDSLTAIRQLRQLRQIRQLRQRIDTGVFIAPMSFVRVFVRNEQDPYHNHSGDQYRNR